jgi:hypothetical protein
VDALIVSHGKAGLPVTLSVEGDLAAVPSVVSREVYRIVQEGLTNVQRHSGAVPTEVRLAVTRDELTAEVLNAAGREPRARRDVVAAMAWTGSASGCGCWAGGSRLERTATAGGYWPPCRREHDDDDHGPVGRRRAAGA